MWMHYLGKDFWGENGEEHENSEEKIMQWVETDILSHKTLSRETQRDPILSGILERIKKNVWSNCTLAERLSKEAWHELERGIIFSADAIVQPQILRKDKIKSVHDDIHGVVAATQRRLRLQAWWPGHCKDVEEHIRRCPKCMEIKTFKQTKIHTWSKERTPWTKVHMDHAHIRDIGLFLILVNSFFGWLEVIKVRDGKATTVRQILRTMFTRNVIPKTFVTDNTWEFCDENLVSWLS